MKARSMFMRILCPAVAAPLLAAALFFGFPGSAHDFSIRVSSPYVASAPAAGAAEAPSAAVSVARRTPAPGVAGMVIGRDPETGALGMPTREQLQELSNMEQIRLEDSSADLVPVFHPDGSISLDLKGRFQEFATVRIAPSGKKTFQCVDGDEDAERVIRNPSLGSAEGARAENPPATRPAEER